MRLPHIGAVATQARERLGTIHHNPVPGDFKLFRIHRADFEQHIRYKLSGRQAEFW